jgi:hypothetical protein
MVGKEGIKGVNQIYLRGVLEGRQPLFLIFSPSPRVERGIKGVRLIKNLF